LGQNHRSLYEILQLPHVAGPVIGVECFHRFGWDRIDTFLHSLGEFLGEVSDQQWNVFSTLAQGRGGDRKDLKPIVQIVAELLFFNQSSQIPVGCGNDANIDADRASTPQSLKFLLLKHAEQLHL
jgi:hypothetical protein